MFINNLFKPRLPFLNHFYQIPTSKIPISSHKTVLSAAQNNDHDKRKLIIPTHAQKISKGVYTARRDISAPKSPLIVILDEIFDKLFNELIDPLQMTRETALEALNASTLEYPPLVDELFQKKDISTSQLFVKTYFRLRARDLQFFEESPTIPESPAKTKKPKPPKEAQTETRGSQTVEAHTVRVGQVPIQQSNASGGQAADSPTSKRPKSPQVTQSKNDSAAETKTIKIPRRIPYPLARRAAQRNLSNDFKIQIPSERNKTVAELRESFKDQFNTIRESNPDLPMYGEEDSITNRIESSLHTKKTSLILKELGNISYFSEIQEAAIKNLRSVNLKQAVERQMAGELDLEVDPDVAQESYCIEDDEHIPFIRQFLVRICRDIPEQLLEVRNEKGFTSLTEALEASLQKIFVKSKEMSGDEFSRLKDVAVKEALEQLGVKIIKTKNTKNLDTRFKKPD